MNRKLKILNIVGFVLMIAVNAAFSIYPISGKTVSQVSDKHATLFTPAGFTFAIWGLIYLSLLAFIIYQMTGGAGKAVKRIGILFFFSSILNSAWIIAWCYERIGLSLVIMTILLLMLMAIYIKINKERYGTSLIFVRFPFKLYFAWVCIAAAANFSVFLKHINWDGFGIGEEVWTVIILAFILGLTTVFTLVKKDMVFGTVVLWTVTGMLIKHTAELGSQYPSVIAAIVVIYAAVIIEYIYDLYKIMTR
jgi:hypothetical protein